MGRRNGKWRGRTLLLLSLSAALLCNGCAAVEYVRAEVQAQSEYDDGLVLYGARQYGRAVPHFERALALKPDFDDAEAYLAWSYYYLGNYPEASRHFLQALVRQPNWEGLHDGLGWSRYRAGNYRQALDSFRNALDLDRNYRDAGVGYAFALFEMGRYAEAMPHLERLVREGEPGSKRSAPSDHEDVRSRFAWALFYLGDYTRAREQFIKGIAAKPEWAGLQNGLGWSCLRLGDKVQAQRAFERALELNPNIADAKAGLAQSQP
jgi:tetratricopeptide (TPR) repeat protein